MFAVALFTLLVSSPHPAGAKTTSVATRPAGFSTLRARSDDFGAPRAPDGAPGFGYGRTRRELERFFRSNDGPEKAFLAELETLARDVELEIDAVDVRYEESGVYALLGDVSGTPARLGARFHELASDVGRVLRTGGSQADWLARLLTDQRFRVRANVIDGAAAELFDLRGALRLLSAQTDGWVDLTDGEVAALCERCDLAAARLRAIRQDLRALRDLPCAYGSNAPWQREHEQLLMFTRMHDHERIERDLDPLLARLDAAESAMSRPLFTTALAEQCGEELADRAQRVAQAEELVPQARALDPDRVSAVPATKAIAGMSKTDRRQRAAKLASEAVGFDPLDEEAVWIAAVTSDAAQGRFESRRWFDRYLALHGIRAHDDRTFRGRTLSGEEKRALDAVQEAERVVR